MENFLSDTLRSVSVLDYKYLILQILERGVSKKKPEIKTLVWL